LSSLVRPSAAPAGGDLLAAGTAASDLPQVGMDEAAELLLLSAEGIGRDSVQLPQVARARMPRAAIHHT
jgi:hypothetical protein